MNPLDKIFRKIKKLTNKPPRRYKQLLNELDKTEARKIMEIGTWSGERARQMIEISKKHHDKKDVFYYGLDLFEDLTDEKFEKEISKRPPSKQEVQLKLEQTGANINLIQGDTTTLPEEVWSSLPKMDFVFIDGGHSLETVENDWRKIQKLMHENTVVIFDDYWPDRLDAGAKVTVDHISREYYNVEVLPIVDRFQKEWGELKIQFAMVKKVKLSDK